MSRHIVFLSDYDMLLAAHLVQGVDVWLNTPRRPWEASGTSGMKVLVNGGLNFSELDGWWVEAYRPEVGWALGDGKEHGDDPSWDAQEAERMFAILEKEIIPCFYDRADRGIPVAWVNKVRQSMATLTPFFSATRTVREYTEKYYLPGAKRYADRAAENGALGRKISSWRQSVEAGWDKIRFGEMQVSQSGAGGAEQYAFDVQLQLGDLPPENVTVELYAQGMGDGAPYRQQLGLRSRAGADGITHYAGVVPANRPAADYTARVMPYMAEASVPLETARVLWQR